MGKEFLVCVIALLQWICVLAVNKKFIPEISRAHVVYNENTNQLIIHCKQLPGKKNYVASANFTNSINQTGWANLEVWTNGNFPDSVQARAAGYLEGFLSHELIYQAYVNTLQDYCYGRDTYCNKLNSFLATNTKWIQKMYKKLRKESPFWHQVGLFYEQMEGMKEGWDEAAITTGHTMGSFGFIWFNIVGDLEEFEKIFGGGKFMEVGQNTTEKKEKSFNPNMSPSCSALIKILPDGSDIYTSHVTWLGYKFMIRILKKYSFEVHSTANNDSPIITGRSMSFSSYPGVLYSLDDFTVLSSGLVSLETSIENFNGDLWKFVKPTGQVLEGIRSMAANRLASTGKEWVDVFSRHNSGTYNNQWMIVDYKLFKPGKPLRNGLLWILEQLPSTIVSRDMTDMLRAQSFWSSYNSPFFPSIFNLSGCPSMVEKYGDWYSYDKTPRALIFKRGQSSVTDLDSMIKLMRYNDFLNDPLSRCETCNPPYSGANAISARNDLSPVNGTYPFRDLSYMPYGASDCKVTSHSMMRTLDFVAVSGPTFDPLPPFQWSLSNFNNVSHVGQPDLWNFKPYHTQWNR